MAAPKKKAPPLGKLSTSAAANPTIPAGKGIVPRPSKGRDSLFFGLPKPTNTARTQPIAPPVVGAGSNAGIPNAPKPRELTFRAPKAPPQNAKNNPVPKNAKSTPTTSVAAPAPVAPVVDRGPQIFNGGDSVADHAASPMMVDSIITGNTDPNLLPVVAPSGSPGRDGLQMAFGDNGPAPQYINNNPVVAPTALPDNAPLPSLAAPVFNYATGPTQSMYDQEARTREITAIAPTLGPTVQPIMQYNPQALDPEVTGGVVPKAEDNNPLSWLFGENTSGNLDIFGGKFAGGTGILGAVGHVFGRLTNVPMGIAADVARTNAAVIDNSQSSGLLDLFKGGLASAAAKVGSGKVDLGKTLQTFGSGFSTHFNNNSPENRGSPIKSIGGTNPENYQAASIVNKSYTLAGLVGTNDFSFSGVGNRGAGRDVIVNKQFNPFGFQNPFGQFKTHAVNPKTGKTVYFTPELGTNGGNYNKPLSNTWLMAGGLAADVLTGGRIDRAAEKLLPNVLRIARKGVPTTIGRAATAAKAGSSASFNPAVEARTQADPNLLARGIAPGKLVARPGAGPIPKVTLPTAGPTPGGALVYQPRARTGEIIPYNPTQHSGGAIVPANAPQVLPWGYVPAGQKRLPGTVAALPAGDAQRMLPAGANPFAPPGRYADDVLDVDFSSGGAIVIRKSGEITPARSPIITLGADTPRLPAGKAGIDPQVKPARAFDVNTNGAVRERVVFEANGKPPTVLISKSVADIVDVTPSNLPNVRVVSQSVPLSLPPATVISPTVPGVYAQIDDVARANATRLQRIESRTAAVATQRTTQLALPPAVVEPLRVAPPQEPANYITAEALSPTLSSGDIVRQLTSADYIPGATYNPRLVLRQERSLASVVQLARSVELPGGVRILADNLSDATVNNFARLSRKVDSAIVAAGLNATDPEVAALRRMFQKNGSPLPDNLAPDFSIRVAGRRTDTPASYVKPAQAEPSGYTPRYPLSDDYGLAVKVKQDKAGNIIPATYSDEVLQQPAVLGERVFKSYEPAERAAIVREALAAGDTASTSLQRAADDVVNPAVGLGDDVATSVYARENLPKDIVPTTATAETDKLLSTRHEAHQQLEETNKQLAELTMQLTDMERNLDAALARIDELPDIGKINTDITIPVTPYKPVPKDSSKQVVQRIDAAVDKSRAVTNADVLAKAEDARAAAKADKKTGLYKTYEPNRANLPAGTTVKEALAAGVVGRTHNEILDRYSLTFKSGAKGRPLSVRGANSAVLDGAAYSHGPKGNISKATTVSAVTDTTSDLFHGTRNASLDLGAADPLQGAARSEYGTALWLTRSEDVAMSAASRAVPENIPSGISGRALGGQSFIHSVDPATLAGKNVIPSTASLPRATLHDIVDSLSDNVDEPWVGELTNKLSKYIGDNKTVTPAMLFSKLDEFTAEATEKLFRQRPTEEELTQIQRVASDMLAASGIDGVSNGKGIALYSGSGLRTGVVHDVSDMVPTNPAAHVLEEVNLLSRMSEAEPDSMLLKVQLAEARARAANYIKQDVMDEMEVLTREQVRHIDRMMDADDRLRGVAIRNKPQLDDAAREADEAIYRKFEKELNKDYTNGCL